MTDKARAVYSCICASVLLSYIMRETNRKKHLPGLKENSQSGAGGDGDKRGGSDTHFWRHQSARLSLAAEANCFSSHSRNIDGVINHAILGPICQRRRRAAYRPRRPIAGFRLQLVIAKTRPSTPSSFDLCSSVTPTQLASVLSLNLVCIDVSAIFRRSNAANSSQQSRLVSAPAHDNVITRPSLRPEWYTLLADIRRYRCHILKTKQNRPTMDTV